MLKEGIFLLGILLLFGYLQSLSEPEEKVIDAATIFDTEATSTISVSLTIQSNNPPNITINSPNNKSYSYNMSILFNFSFSDSDSPAISWAAYSVDNGTNTTLTLTNNKSETTVDLSMGGHWLTVYANDTSNNLNSKSRRFNLNYTHYFFVNFSEFDGSTHNFSGYNSSYLQGFQNMILEKQRFGKIFFLEQVNISDDVHENDSDEIIDFNRGINISDKYISLDESFFSNLMSKQVTLYFYNLTFTNPVIKRNNITCPSTICKDLVYSGGTLSFNVTGFSSYGAEEGGGSDSGGASGSGGAGGSGGSSKKKKPSEDITEKPTAKPEEEPKQAEAKKEGVKPSEKVGELAKIVTEHPALARPSYASLMFVLLVIISLIYFEYIFQGKLNKNTRRP